MDDGTAPLAAPTARPAWVHWTGGASLTMVPTIVLGYYAYLEHKLEVKAAKSVSVARAEAEVARLETQAANFRVSYDALLKLCER